MDYAWSIGESKTCRASLADWITLVKSRHETLKVLGYSIEWSIIAAEISKWYGCCPM
jgi:hypothetical protein